MLSSFACVLSTTWVPSLQLARCLLHTAHNTALWRSCDACQSFQFMSQEMSRNTRLAQNAQKCQQPAASSDCPNTQSYKVHMILQGRCHRQTSPSSTMEQSPISLAAGRFCAQPAHYASSWPASVLLRGGLQGSLTVHSQPRHTDVLEPSVIGCQQTKHSASVRCAQPACKCLAARSSVHSQPAMQICQNLLSLAAGRLRVQPAYYASSQPAGVLLRRGLQGQAQRVQRGEASAHLHPQQ